mmetsp:Transcript_21636/g.43213  ORF Transcript_21636/g.43213 Transcript_21636/m.43213 type:complete len:628 (+) Transcript_21636:77-1960(+)
MPFLDKENNRPNRRRMSLPKELEDALDNAPKYNPTAMSSKNNDKNSKIHRARRRMLEDRGEHDEAEELERATDRHSVEARMMNELLGDMGVPSRQNKVGGERRRRRSRDAGEEKDGNDSDDASVSSVSSVVSTASSVGGPKKSPRVRIGSSASGNSANDLMTKMAGRLARVEMTCKRLKDEASKKDSLLSRQRKRIATLEDAVASAKAKETAAKLTELADENDQLRKQIIDMEKFLKDYGLVWVGSNDYNERLVGTKGGGELEELEEEKHEGRDREVEKEKMVAKPSLQFDRDIFCQRVKELNSMINADKASVVTTGKKASLKYQDGVRVILFEDGVAVGTQRVMKWDDEKCVKFVADIMDGFFPAMFKKEFPDGVKLDLVDSRERHSGASAPSFAGSGNSMLKNSNIKGLASLGNPDFRPMKAEEFLKMLPEKVVGPSGQVHDIRGDVGERMSGVDKSVGEEVEGVETKSSEGGGNESSSKARNAADAAERRLRTGASVAGKAGTGENVPGPSTPPPKPQRLNSTLRGRRVSVKSESDEAAPTKSAESSQTTTLKVKGCSSKPLTFTLGYDATVGRLRSLIEAAKDRPGEFEIRTAFPNRVYEDESATLEEAGLVPNASLNVRFLK